MKSFGLAKQVFKTLTILSCCLLVSSVIMIAAYQNFTLSMPEHRDAFAAKCFPYLLGLAGVCLFSGIWYTVLKEANSKAPYLLRLRVFQFIKRRHIKSQKS